MKKTFKNIIVSILIAESRLVLFRRKPKIVVVTGSVGKTSTKDAIAHALSVSFNVRKSEKSYNSEIGVPLTILGLKNAWQNPLLWFINIAKGFFEIIRPGKYPPWLVLEVGADKPGDLIKIFSWLTPHIVVGTRFPDVPVHIEFYESIEELVEEESIPMNYLIKDGLLILNKDDKWTNTFSQKNTSKIITYGLNPVADVSGSATAITYKEEGGQRKLKGIRFRVDYGGNSVPVEIIGALGIQHVYPALAAFAVVVGEGINLIRIGEAFQKYVAPPGRMKIIEGIKKTTIIDDTYNSSPVAVLEALFTLKLIENTPRKIAVLGDMLELGKFSDNQHKKVGENIRQCAQMLVTVGTHAKGMAEGAVTSGMDESKVFIFKNSKEASNFIKEILKEGDVILVKGSQGIRMERIVEEIMLHREEKNNLLVRQEKEWLKR